MILITLTSCYKSPSCNSTHTISGQILNGSTMQPMEGITVNMRCGPIGGGSHTKNWSPITDKYGNYSITYNCNELSADSINVGITEPYGYRSIDTKRTLGGEIYHKANFNGVYNFYLAKQGKMCVTVKEKISGNLKKSLPQTIKIAGDPSYVITLDSTSVGKFWTYTYKPFSILKLYQGSDSNSINSQINVRKTNAGCTIDPFIDTFVLTY